MYFPIFYWAVFVPFFGLKIWVCMKMMIQIFIKFNWCVFNEPITLLLLIMVHCFIASTAVVPYFAYFYRLPKTKRFKHARKFQTALKHRTSRPIAVSRLSILFRSATTLGIDILSLQWQRIVFFPLVVVFVCWPNIKSKSVYTFMYMYQKKKAKKKSLWQI